MKISALAACGLMMCAPTALQAQSSVQVGALQQVVKPTAIIAAPVQESVLRAGIEVPLRTREELTTKKKALRVGQRIQLEVANNIESGGMVVVPSGTPAVGEITEVRNKGMWGKSGYISVRIVSMRLGDRNVRLSGTFDDKGVTGTGGVVAAIAIIPIAGFLTTGTSAMIPSGSAVKGFLDEDIAFRSVASQPAVLEVPTVTKASLTVPAAVAN